MGCFARRSAGKVALTYRRRILSDRPWASRQGAGSARLRERVHRNGREPVDDAAVRQRLETLLDELDASSRTLAGEHGDRGELSMIDQHSAEAASELTEFDRDEALRGVVESQRRQVLEALGRLDAGTYGRCVVCGTDLPEERLDARPEAARCVSCQHDLEIAR